MGTRNYEKRMRPKLVTVVDPETMTTAPVRVHDFKNRQYLQIHLDEGYSEVIRGGTVVADFELYTPSELCERLEMCGFPELGYGLRSWLPISHTWEAPYPHRHDPEDIPGRE